MTREDQVDEQVQVRYGAEWLDAMLQRRSEWPLLVVNLDRYPFRIGEIGDQLSVRLHSGEVQQFEIKRSSGEEDRGIPFMYVLTSDG